MSDDAKLGLVAGVLAVLAVAVFSSPKDAAKESAKTAPPTAIATMGTATSAPSLPPAAMAPAK